MILGCNYAEAQGTHNNRTMQSTLVWFGSVKRSSRRLQAMQDISHRDFMGLCRDCRARCRSCGRRPSAVLMAKRRRY
ncbi:uncharacterized protein Dere_GG21084 [Drosophila erecta]|uniref:Uncharacterized protein n=1 Tax=Drosophila erecta TaxID=7220 RepID=B3NLD9_DROER|nr:uncharacterized protein Dere_GG21084 [Drosophila erecta]